MNEERKFGEIIVYIWGKGKIQMLFMQCSASVLKDTHILALIHKINSPKPKRFPALILPFKASCTEMQIYLTATPSM